MHVVIVGGGFGGIKTALELSKRHIGKITLISEHAYFLHHATLYATATGKSTEESVIPIVELIQGHPSIEFYEDTIESFDPHRKLVRGQERDYHYDKVIFALGSVTNFRGIKGLEKHAYGIQTLAEVRAFQDHIHEEVVRQKLDKEYFVIGAGLTGVEMAGALYEHLESLKSLYRLEHAQPKITLVEAESRILPHLSSTASKKVAHRLNKLGITLITNEKVNEVSGHHITIGGRVYSTTTAIWTCGATNNSFFTQRANAEYFRMTKDGKVIVNPYLEAFEDTYVIGDNNNVSNSGLASSAMKQATRVAKNIALLASGQHQRAYHPTRAMIGVPIGSKWAYTERFGIYQAGLLGYQFRRWQILNGYNQLMPMKKALPIWRSHDIKDVDDIF